MKKEKKFSNFTVEEALKTSRIIFRRNPLLPPLDQKVTKQNSKDKDKDKKNKESQIKISELLFSSSFSSLELLFSFFFSFILLKKLFVFFIIIVFLIFE